MTVLEPPAKLTPEERTAVLERYVADQTRHGWRVVSQTTAQAQLVKGKPTSHLLHFFLTLFTLGFWVFVWIGLAIFAGEKQRFVTVDE